MKKFELIIAVPVLIVLMALNSCQRSEKEERDNAEAKAMRVAEDLKKAENTLLTDLHIYKKKVEVQISANEKSIQEFKTRIASGKNEGKAEYEKKINELEQKNLEMKTKLNEYTLEGKAQWDSFKSEFSQDMDELGAALKAFTVDSTS